MIVKLSIKDGWKLISELDSVEIRRGCKKVATNGGYFETLSGDKFDIDADNVFESYVSDQEYSIVSAIKRNSEAWICVAFNSTGYLMNDDGKTIETI